LGQTGDVTAFVANVSVEAAASAAAKEHEAKMASDAGGSRSGETDAGAGCSMLVTVGGSSVPPPPQRSSYDRPMSRDSNVSKVVRRRSANNFAASQVQRTLSEADSSTGHRKTTTISFTQNGNMKAQEDMIKEGLERFWKRLNGDIKEEEEFRVLRQSLTTGRWTLYTAGGKAKKQHQYVVKRALPKAPDLPKHERACPFCTGNEDKTPDPLLAFDADGKECEVGVLPKGWRVRVIPNIFPLLVTPTGEQGGLYGKAFAEKLASIPHSAVAEGKHDNGYLGHALNQTVAMNQPEAGAQDSNSPNKILFRQISAMGYSEVVVENSLHNGLLAIVSKEQVALGLRALQSRGRVLVKQQGVRQLLYFKQYGALSGGSLVHPHMQVITLPLLTPETQTRLQRAWDYHTQFKKCAVCQAHITELRNTSENVSASIHSSRLIYESKHFVVVVPFAASQYRLSVVPLEHSPSWLGLTREQVEDLAETLQLVMEGIYDALDDPEYNIYIFSVDREEEVQRSEAVHWSVEIHPRFPAELGGLELASGIRMVSGLPEEWARTMKTHIETILKKRSGAVANEVVSDSNCPRPAVGDTTA